MNLRWRFGAAWMAGCLSCGILHGAEDLWHGCTLTASENGRPAAVGQSNPAWRRIPPLLALRDLEGATLGSRAIDLTTAHTAAGANFEAGRLGKLKHPDGRQVSFNPEIVLVKFRGRERVCVLRVPHGSELSALRRLAERGDVEFAELDVLQQRAFMANDPFLPQQWHHARIGSAGAWNYSLGRAEIRVAIVDTPFQMDHPDLSANTDTGWDAVNGVAVTSSAGIDHSTMAAGLVAGVIDNGVGIAGSANCRVLPINVNGFISELCDAVYWAASNQVRVVNISWSGADSEALESAAAYFKSHANGVVILSGLNSPIFVNYPNHPNLWCVSMTDAADNPQSAYGFHIDLSAPGWQVFATRTGGGYGVGSGSSYAAPIVSGLAALLLSINPVLSADEVMSIIQNTAVDKGEPGWDMWFGWGRVDFAAAAAEAAAALPRIRKIVRNGSRITVTADARPGLAYELRRAAGLSGASWETVPGVVIGLENGQVHLTDPSPPPGASFYRVLAERP